MQRAVHRTRATSATTSVSRPVEFPARIHVLLASNAPAALVLRRGPSGVVASIGWKRDTDTFSLGQWMRSRIYERDADITPDGSHWAYYTLKAGGIVVYARVPWLKAVPDGERDLIRSKLVLHYASRLRRDGWTRVAELGYRLDSATVFERPMPHGWTLRKLAHEQIGAAPGKGMRWDEHELEHVASKQLMPRPEWEWADADGESLVWAERGSLYRAAMHPEGPGPQHLLADLNDMRFERRLAPY